MMRRDFSVPELNAIAARSETFAAVAGYAYDQMVVDMGHGSIPRVLAGQFVTPNFFATLGLRPVIGPGLPAAPTSDAPGADMAMVIAHSLRTEIGGDLAVIGRVVR